MNYLKLKQKIYEAIERNPLDRSAYEEIGDMTLEEARKILDIPVIWFKYKDNYLSETDWLNGKKLPGFYAEDVYNYFPQATQLNENGEPEDWNFRNFFIIWHNINHHVPPYILKMNFLLRKVRYGRVHIQKFLVTH